MLIILTCTLTFVIFLNHSELTMYNVNVDHVICILSKWYCFVVTLLYTVKINWFSLHFFELSDFEIKSLFLISWIWTLLWVMNHMEMIMLTISVNSTKINMFQNMTWMSSLFLYTRLLLLNFFWRDNNMNVSFCFYIQDYYHTGSDPTLARTLFVIGDLRSRSQWLIIHFSS